MDRIIRVGRQYNRRTEFRIIGDLPEQRIIYDQNRPEYIDKSGVTERDSNLRVNTDEEDDGTPASGEIMMLNLESRVHNI